MKEKEFSINQNGCSIRCKLYDAAGTPERVVLYAHGFGGHKNNRAAARFAEYVTAKQKGVAVLCFDWPCHGEDARKKLLLDDCEMYIRCLTDYVHLQYPGAALQVYATSFGGYLFLRYIAEHGNPFDRLALRCPAVPMYQVMTERIVTAEEAEKLKKGKDILVGFDRKVKISPDFLDSLKAADLTSLDFTPFCNDILILHGTKDEIVPIRAVEAFAEKNRIPFFPIENADHRFIDPKAMHEAIELIAEFLA